MAFLSHGSAEPVTVYRRTDGRPVETFITALKELQRELGSDLHIDRALVTGSGRELLSGILGIPAINEISAHAAGVRRTAPQVRTIIEVGGQDSKFIKIDASSKDASPNITAFRMNELCAAGTGAFLDEQSARLEIPVESFGEIALQSERPASIAGRCAVFAKTDMIHRAQEGTPLPDILMGLALALARNYLATLVRGEAVEPVVSLQGGVMANPAVVKAFMSLLELSEDRVIRPPYYNCLGAVGCAGLALSRPAIPSVSFSELIAGANSATGPRDSSRTDGPLKRRAVVVPDFPSHPKSDPQSPLIMGLDIGSVSVKGVLIDGGGAILRDAYTLSHSKPLDVIGSVIDELTLDGYRPELLAVTGSGRYLVGRLLGADLIVNEITAQARAAVEDDPTVETVLELGGQDSKWISIKNGVVDDFEMNRVCAAGTGSFIMEQAARLGFRIGDEFSEAAFRSQSPVDLGSRCTVFMESDLIHHQNNGASREDLAAGVCVSVVRNYLERVTNGRHISERVTLLGGVAADSAVRAAFADRLGREPRTPSFFKVSGALGAALKARDAARVSHEIQPSPRVVSLNAENLQRKSFVCKGCPNRCAIDTYRGGERTVYHGGICDRWEAERSDDPASAYENAFRFRTELLESQPTGSAIDSAEHVWGMPRIPHYYEWFPFWRAFFAELGVELRVAEPTTRTSFEKGLKFLKVETCLPVKAMAGQLADLVDQGVDALFVPSLVSEPSDRAGTSFLTNCPYIQASSQFFLDSFDAEFRDPVINLEVDPDSFESEHRLIAADLGHYAATADRAIERGFECLERFREQLHERAGRFMAGVPADEIALVVLGKPYHTADPFLNMNLGGLFRRLGVRAIPSDILPAEDEDAEIPVTWKHQRRMIEISRRIAEDPRLFPVMISFFGCGPDPFTIRHIHEALKSKPMLMLEMDEHTSSAGLLTRLEAYLETIRSNRCADSRPPVGIRVFGTELPAFASSVSSTPHQSRSRRSMPEPGGSYREAISTYGYRLPAAYREAARPADKLFLPYIGESTLGFAAAARSFGVDTAVLPSPDKQSEELGLPHALGGECHPYKLLLGDYLKLASSLDPATAERGLFFMIGPDACRLGQYPLYMEQIRRGLGLQLRVVPDIDTGLKSFGISEKNRLQILLRAWEGMIAFDMLARLYFRLRPLASNTELIDAVYSQARKKLFMALSEGRVRRGVEEALHDLSMVPLEESAVRPAVSVTGDYYTRVVSFANNDVYREVERLGGIILTPPTFSDSFKMGTMRDFLWSVVNALPGNAAWKGVFFMLQAMCEFRVKGGRNARRAVGGPLDILGWRMWKSAAEHIPTRLPGGITAPVVTALSDVENGASGVLNLITLNCSYGTVVTTALARTLKAHSNTPMLTLVYDGLKKTNEKTRLEAFMEQVRDRFPEK